MTRGGQALRDLATFVAIAALLAAVYLLPPDTSLAEIRAAGTLRLCVPPSYPPLVTEEADLPGIDVELWQAIADNIGVKLALVRNAAMGRDFNPRGWRLSRAQCQAIAGGVVASAMTRSFLDVTRPYAETGWAVLSRQRGATIDGKRVGVLVAVSGLDRIALSGHLRNHGAKAVLVRDADALAAGISDGLFDAAVTEALHASRIAAEHDFAVAWLPGFERYPLAFGLWKGDLTLKRAVAASLEKMRADGRLERVVERYIGRESLFGEAGA
jgi:polar amino acid transport system substrate-binding protein/cystine transport system substrate-binding protein/membrane-bound lytic murein transglycosylase F